VWLIGFKYVNSSQAGEEHIRTCADEKVVCGAPVIWLAGRIRQETIMFRRFSLGALLLTGLLVLTSCSNSPQLTSITVNPSTVTATPTDGLQTQFTAIGNYTHPGHPAITRDITDQVTWSSATPQMVEIASATGLATVTGAVIGNTSIYASAPGFNGDVVGTATFNVQEPQSSGGSVRSLVIRQGSQNGSSVQFTAMGRTTDGTLVQLEGQPKWSSTTNQVATIDEASGLANVLGAGRSTIVATYSNPDGTTAVGVTHLDIP
jgi:hypothetical protein